MFLTKLDFMKKALKMVAESKELRNVEAKASDQIKWNFLPKKSKKDLPNMTEMYEQEIHLIP